MNFIEEIRIFTKGVFDWICVFLIFSLIFFFCNFKIITIYWVNVYVPFSNERSFSVEVFEIIKNDLLPKGVELITTNPMSAFVAQISISLLLAFIITIPLLFYNVILYIQPALLKREKRVVAWSLIPFVTLFLSGCAFSYYFIIPSTFNVLYPFATVMGAIPFFSITEFIQYVFGLMIGVGIMFLLPLFMILLSFLKIIPGSFWTKKWKFALLFFLVLSAIITPDGTGITMFILFLPLIALYFAGCFFAKRVSDNA